MIALNLITFLCDLIPNFFPLISCNQLTTSQSFDKIQNNLCFLLVMVMALYGSCFYIRFSHVYLLKQIFMVYRIDFIEQEDIFCFVENNLNVPFSASKINKQVASIMLGRKWYEWKIKPN